MIVVSDTSPITNLIKIGRIEVLQRLYEEVVVPDAVKDEIDFLPENRAAFAELGWIRIVSVRDRKLFSSLLTVIDRGEAAAIALAVEMKADLVLIDETDGRFEAKHRGLNVIGLVGILIDAKQEGLIELVKPELDALRDEARFWIDSRLYERALIAAGEK